MVQKTRGIVLHVISYGEASVIAHIYTEEFGMQSFLLNGVRKPKARFNANLLQPLTCIEVVAYIKPSKSLHRVSEFAAAPAFESIPYDTFKTTIALFLAEVMYRSIREEEKNPSLFDFIHHSILYLDHQQESFHLFHLLFMIKLSRFLGFYPQNHAEITAPVFDMREGVFTNQLPMHSDVLDPVTGKNLSRLLDTTLESLHQLSFSSTERKALLRSLVYYYELHQTQGFHLQSMTVLEEVMNN
jgi:DNA repair protein RecO (recombination protein O)